MNIGIIAANNIRYSPYINFYTNILDRIDCGYEVIYPLRSDVVDQTPYKSIGLIWSGFSPKILQRFAYYHEVKRLCESRGYDFLIVLTTSSAVMLSTWLALKYRGKYIVDIRDYTHENLPPYYLLESLAVKNSALNVISSSRFKQFLPRVSYQTCHNISVDRLRSAVPWKKKADGPISIGYVGSISYEKQCRALMDLVKMDKRFTFEFFGTGPAEKGLQDKWLIDKPSNIRFNGAYEPHDKARIIESIDILFNAYGNDSLLLTCALSNKLYDAMFFHRPIIVSPQTYMEELSGIIGFALNLETEHNLDALYNWYCSLDETEVNEYMNKMMSQFDKENKQTIDNIIECVEQARRATK